MNGDGAESMFLLMILEKIKTFASLISVPVGITSSKWIKKIKIPASAGIKNCKLIIKKKKKDMIK